MNDRILLSPCPFCGKDGVAYLRSFVYHIGCINMDCPIKPSIECYPEDLNANMDAWNSRYYTKDMIDIGVYADNILTRLRTSGYTRKD